MANLPSADLTIDDQANAGAAGAGYIVVAGCVGTSADATCRVFSSPTALVAQHGYCPAVDYAAMHISETRKPVIFIGLPIATAAVLGSQRNSGTGTALITVSAGSAGYLEQIDGIITVTTGGTVGTNGIVLDLSLDGNRTKKPVRLGTASSYTVPYVGVVLTFGSGTMVAGDTFSFRTTAPMWDSSGIASIRTALAAQQKQSRTWLIVGDASNSTEAGYVTTAVNAYETTNKRFTRARVQVKDGGTCAPLARCEGVKKYSKLGTATLTFAEVGATGDTITRSAGSWITDGFAVGDVVTVSGAVAGGGANNVTGPITALSATVLTFGTTDLVDEGPITSASVVGSTGMTFTEVGATGDTISRSAGSWLNDGFAVGDVVAVSGTASNNIAASAPITALSATVMTLDTDDLTAEVIGAHNVSITKVQSKATHMTAMATAFASISDTRRICLGLGRARKLSPLTGYMFRRPVQWAASIREYQHDVHVTTWWKELGPVDGWDIFDANQNLVEFNDDVDGGATIERFTSFRTWGNGPVGAFIACDLTRAADGKLLGLTNNLDVANVACRTVQAETEMWVGRAMVLKSDGTATEASLLLLEGKINTALQVALMNGGTEGQRASKAEWKASRTDVLNVINARQTGVLDLRVLGTLFHVDTVVRVR